MQPLESIFAQCRPDVVFNLAAQPRGAAGFDEMRQQLAVTTGGAINIAECAIKYGDPLIVQLGSSEEYGGVLTPFTEQQSDAPISSYSVAKAAATRMLLLAHRQHQLPVIVVRPTVVFGPLQRGSMFIPYAISHYMEGKSPDLTPCEQTRDFVYISDLVEALLELGLRPDLSGEIFNVGAGKGVPLRTVADSLMQLFNYSAEPGFGKRPYRTNEVMRHQADITKITNAIGWRPSTDLQMGLQQTVAWWRAQAANAATSL